MLLQSSRSKSIQPSQVASERTQHAPLPPQTGDHGAQEHLTKRQTTTVTEYYAPTPPAHQGPLPRSRAETMSTAVQAHAVPLPKSKSAAPTVYSNESPRSGTEGHRGIEMLLSPPSTQTAQQSRGGKNAPNVNVIDYARAMALPASRGTTMVESPKAQVGS